MNLVPFEAYSHGMCSCLDPENEPIGILGLKSTRAPREVWPVTNSSPPLSFWYLIISHKVSTGICSSFLSGRGIRIWPEEVNSFWVYKQPLTRVQIQTCIPGLGLHFLMNTWATLYGLSQCCPSAWGQESKRQVASKQVPEEHTLLKTFRLASEPVLSISGVWAGTNRLWTRLFMDHTGPSLSWPPQHITCWLVCFGWGGRTRKGSSGKMKSKKTIPLQFLML